MSSTAVHAESLSADAGQRSMVGLHPEALSAWRRLVAVLIQLDTLGVRTPCDEDPEAFSSGDAGIRFVAAKACGMCAVRAECGAFAEANNERAHVWGGRDRTWGAAAELERRRAERTTRATPADETHPALAAAHADHLTDEGGTDAEKEPRAVHEPLTTAQARTCAQARPAAHRRPAAAQRPDAHTNGPTMTTPGRPASSTTRDPEAEVTTRA